MLLGLLAGPAAAAPRSQITIGLAQFPSGLHPYIDPEAVKAYVLAFAARPMTALDADWHNRCLQCTELPTPENGRVRLETRADGSPGMAITVTLRPGLKWADGEALTTRDLAFTARLGADPASGFVDPGLWGRVASVEIRDEQTAVLHLKSVLALADRLPALLPEHIEGPIRAAAGGPAEYLRSSAYQRAPLTPGLYNGPWKVTQYDSGSTIVLDPNPYWNGPAPALRRIVLRAIDNTAALQANLLSGDVDMVPGEAAGLTLDQVLSLRQRFPGRFTYLIQPALGFLHLDANLENPLLADRRVRLALLLGLDRAGMAARLFGGQVTRASAFVAPQDPLFAPDLPDFPYDPARARALLEEAGFPPGSGGVRRNAAGAPLSVELRVAAGSALLEVIGQVAQSQWKAIGVETTLRREAARALFGETLKRRDFPGLVLYTWLLSPGWPPRQLYASDMIPAEANNWAGSNYMGWRNAAVDAALRTAETDLDSRHRQVAWAVLQHAYADDLPALPLFFRPEGHVIPNWLKGYRPTGLTDPTPLTAEEWRAE